VSAPGGQIRARSAPASRMAHARGRGAAAVELATRFARASHHQEGMDQSPHGSGERAGAGSLNAAALKEAVAAAVQEALTNFAPAQAQGENAPVATAQQLTAAVAGSRSYAHLTAQRRGRQRRQPVRPHPAALRRRGGGQGGARLQDATQGWREHPGAPASATCLLRACFVGLAGVWPVT